MLKKILIGIVLIVLVLLAIGFVLPAKLEVTKSVTINAPVQAVFEEINNLEKWQQWQYWNTLDPESKIIYGEKREGTGASYSWDGEKLGKGSITITESVIDQSVAMDINFEGNGTSKGLYTVASKDNATLLTFNFVADQGMNPIARWFNLIIKGEIEKSFDYAGERIKAIAEAKPTFSFVFTEEQTAELAYVGLKHTMSPKDPVAISMQMQKMFTQLDTELKKARVEVKGSPFAIFPSYTPESMEMICAFQVSADAKVKAPYKVETLPANLTVKGLYKGGYENLQAIHDEIQQYIKYKKLTEVGAVREVYITDPTVEKDTTQWLTEIYYPVKKN